MSKQKRTFSLKELTELINDIQDLAGEKERDAWCSEESSTAAYWAGYGRSVRMLLQKLVIASKPQPSKAP